MSVAQDASLAASLFAVDPQGLGGVCLRSAVQPARDQWLQILRELLPPDAPWRRVPFNIGDERLLGGLDLAATLKAARPVSQRGVLAESHGGVIVLAMAERLTGATVAKLTAALDAGEVNLTREGVVLRHPAELGVVALDEGIGAEEGAPPALLERLAFLIDLDGLPQRTPLTPLHLQEEILAARARLSRVGIADEWIKALCATALSLGVWSPRASLLAIRAARVAAALDECEAVAEQHAVLAGKLVLAPRATLAPATEEPPAEPPSPEPPPPDEAARDSAEDRESDPAPDPADLQDILLAAAAAAIPAGLLARLRSDAQLRGRAARAAGGRAGAMRKSGGRGRPAGIRAGKPRGDARLNLIETLRAAAPWQRLRARAGGAANRVQVSAEDLRVTRYKQRAPTLTIFAVDASGSSALNRLAEAKGAVELLLADCYIRRDQVALIAFRGRDAQVLLPPTRSLVRAKRSLAGLPGGGGTPMAAALEAAAALATASQRRGETPTLVLLTDGRANVSRDGSPGREQAHVEALKTAGAIAAARINTLFVDTSPRPQPQAQELARRMNARYLPLPFASSQALSEAVKAATAIPARSA